LVAEEDLDFLSPFGERKRKREVVAGQNLFVAEENLEGSFGNFQDTTYKLSNFDSVFVSIILVEFSK